MGRYFLSTAAGRPMGRRGNKPGTSAAYAYGGTGRRVSSVVFGFRSLRVVFEERKQRRSRTRCDVLPCECDGRAYMSDSH